jgi:hypothetical protein
MDSGLDLSGLEQLKTGLETAAGVVAEVNAGVETIKTLGGSLGLWDPPAGEKAGRWAFVANNAYPGRKRREGETWQASDGSTFAWAFLYDSDPWEGSVKVGEVPRFVPLVTRGPLSRQAGLLRRLWKAGATDADVPRIAAADPMTGLAEADATFDTLSDQRKRAYIANAAMIAAAKYAGDPVTFGQVWGQLVARQIELGWCQYPNDPQCSQKMKSPGVALDGRPMTLYATDYTNAARRAVLVARGASGVLSVEGGETGADGAGAAAAWQACLTDKPLEERRACLDAALSATPSIATALENYPDPWRPFSDPADGFQWIKGVNGAHYVKMGKGDQPYVLRGEVAITLGGMIVLTVAGLGYALVRAYLR